MLSRRVYGGLDQIDHADVTIQPAVRSGRPRLCPSMRSVSDATRSKDTRLIGVGVTVLTLTADLEAGAAALGLLFHTSWQPLVGPLAVVVVTLLLLGRWGS